MTFDLLVAVDAKGGIGKAGALPWRIPGDLAFFKALTTSAPEGKRHAVLMGRRTWESLPPRVRPLPGRLNVVVSRNATLAAEGALVAGSLDAALALAESDPTVARLFVIGGGELYRAALAHPACGDVHRTRVAGDHGCDTFFPELGPEYVLAERSGERRDDGGPAYEFERWTRRGA